LSRGKGEKGGEEVMKFRKVPMQSNPTAARGDVRKEKMLLSHKW